MNLDITFLGTGGWWATQERNTSSILISRDGDNLLFDVGEGTERQMRKFSAPLSLNHIFLTSPLYDHCGGLPGLLRVVDQEVKGQNDTIFVHTPDGTVDEIQSFVDISDYEANISIDNVKEGDKLEKSGYSIEAIETDTEVSSIGYKLSEEPRRGRFNRKKAEKLGIEPGPKFTQLVNGNKVELDDGTIVHPDQVLGPKRPGRRIIYTGDTRPCESIVNKSDHIDVLIHESMFDETQNDRAFETGHSTAIDAGLVAKKANVKKLVLTNISPRYTGRGYVLKNDASSVFEGKVILAKDGLTISVNQRDSVDEKTTLNPSPPETTSVTEIHNQRESIRERIIGIRKLANSEHLGISDKQLNNLNDALEEITNNIDNSVMVLGKFKGPYRNPIFRTPLQERINFPSGD